MHSQPGFNGSQICAYLGAIRQHLFLQFWEDSVAFEVWCQSPKAKELDQGRPRGLYTVQRSGKYWELLLETRGDSEGNFLNLGMLQVLDEGRWEEFLVQRREHDASALEAEGLVSMQCYKYVGKPLGRYYTALTTLVLARRRGRADYERSVERAIAQEVAKPPAYKSITHELRSVTGLYDIISEATTSK